MDFMDRILKCSDCGNDFVFTAGEQLFFFDRQFKNDPKRCKLCKALRAGLGRAAAGPTATATLPLSRTETRTECSACGIETTVPFKPTQGRPVFCRSCFQSKRPTSALEPAAIVATPDLLAPDLLAPDFLAPDLNATSLHVGSVPTVLTPRATMDIIAEAPAASLQIGDRLAADLHAAGEVHASMTSRSMPSRRLPDIF